MSSHPQMKSLDSPSRAFAATLAVHLALCDWVVENWRWYLNFLDDRMQSITEGTLVASFEDERIVEDTNDEEPSVPTTHRSNTAPAAYTTIRSFTGFSAVGSRL